MINKTTAAKKEQNRKWYFYDASNKVLGMLAADIAKILIGKNNPEYSPNQNTGGVVVVTNAEKIALTGNKMKKKVYIHHTGFPKGLREVKIEKIIKLRKQRSKYGKRKSTRKSKNRT
ncbi:MAG: 50S ribosomal protein L13 [candidate division WWE3 bacterium GW2011_GWA2_42_9]|nr:MAG: 50S ribosomal protein L13 [candidate division WWE3 bacterium GW2011_GWA2_42_9]